MLRKILLPTLFLGTLLPGCVTFQISPPDIMQKFGAAPAVLIYSGNPAQISAGGTSTLLWNVIGATSVTIDQGIGQVDVAGSRSVAPARSTTYTLRAINASGSITRSTTIVVVAQSSQSPSYQTMPWAPSMSSFAVTGVTANTEPSGRSGCYTLYALITANGPGAVSYRWESLGGYSFTWTVNFTSAGTQKITLPAGMSGLPSGEYVLHVVSPNDIVSNPAYYTTCR